MCSARARLALHLHGRGWAPAPSRGEPVSNNSTQVLPSLVTQGQKWASLTNTKTPLFEKTARTQNKGEERNAEKWQNTARDHPL